jgi:hypothetical protein
MPRSTEQMLVNDTIPGWTGWGELKNLADLAEQIPDSGVIVEIGSLFGKTAMCLSQAAPTCAIHCYDLWMGEIVIPSDGKEYINSIDTFKEFTKSCKNIFPKKINSVVDLEYTANSVDMFFLDAAHKNPWDWEYIEYFLQKLKPGGILCGHDYYDNDFSSPDIRKNVRRLEIMLKKPVTLYPVEGSIWSFIV